MVILEWLGLGFLVVWVGSKLVEVGGAFGTFLDTVWNADGNEDILQQGAQEFADAIGRLLGALLEGMIMFAAAKGIGAATGAIRSTNFGKSFEQGKLGRWLSERSARVHSGQSLIRSPRALMDARIGDFAGLKNGKLSELLGRIPPNARMRTLRPIEGKVTEGVEYTWTMDGVTWRVRIHGPDASQPPMTHAGSGWVVRVQRGSKYMDSNGTFHRRGVTNERSPHYDEVLANDTHIPIVKDVDPASLGDFHPSPRVGPLPDSDEE